MYVNPLCDYDGQRETSMQVVQDDRRPCIVSHDLTTTYSIGISKYLNNTFYWTAEYITGNNIDSSTPQGSIKTNNTRLIHRVSKYYTTRCCVYYYINPSRIIHNLSFSPTQLSSNEDSSLLLTTTIWQLMHNL